MKAESSSAKLRVVDVDVTVRHDEQAMGEGAVGACAQAEAVLCARRRWSLGRPFPNMVLRAELASALSDSSGGSFYGE